eukprot:1564335-Prymnesium_polylepis.1
MTILIESSRSYTANGGAGPWMSISVSPLCWKGMGLAGRELSCAFGGDEGLTACTCRSASGE